MYFVITKQTTEVGMWELRPYQLVPYIASLESIPCSHNKISSVFPDRRNLAATVAGQNELHCEG